MKNEVIEDLKTEARAMKLVYTTDSIRGYTRKARGRSFCFFDTGGKEIKDGDEIKRMRYLAIPPAWKNVWICSKPNGHLQATGIDIAGRKQYKYHPHWSAVRNERKHDRILEFAKALPAIRKKVEQDISQPEFTMEKVLAMAMTVMDKTLIRVGNEAYTKLYGSFGLTSLRNRHIKITGNKMIISFRGKKGVFQEVNLTHSRLARMMRKLKDIPGQELFQYFDENGVKKTIDSDSVNSYIELASGNEFTAKDFRTWSGTVEAFAHLANLVKEESALGNDKDIISALDHVAQKLGNTRMVCKKYYVHPKLLSSYTEGRLHKYLAKLTDSKQPAIDEDRHLIEKLVIEFIENESVNAGGITK